MKFTSLLDGLPAYQSCCYLLQQEGLVWHVHPALSDGVSGINADAETNPGRELGGRCDSRLPSRLTVEKFRNESVEGHNSLSRGKRKTPSAHPIGACASSTLVHSAFDYVVTELFYFP